MFATPFVLVAGCKHPAEPPRDPAPVVHDAPASRDADVGQPVDGNGPMTDEEVRAMCAQPGANCNPPMPKPDARPAPTLQGRVVFATAGKNGQKSIVTISIGARDGVAESWKGTLVEGARTLGTFTILTVKDNSTIGYSDAAPDMISNRSQVRFPPPDTK